MSAIGIIRLAAIVIQVADLGGRLSVNLFTFARKAKNANKIIDALSQELAATGAVLKQLGETIQNDENLRLCSQEAITTTSALVEDAEISFVSLEVLVANNGNTGTDIRRGFNAKQPAELPFLGTQIEQLRANLERLKSSFLVILNVLKFAEQLRNREALLLLKDQKELIRFLAAEKDENEKRYAHVLQAISNRPSASISTTAGDNGTRDKGVGFGSVDLNVSSVIHTDKSFTMSPINVVPPAPTPVPTIPDIDLPVWLRHHHERIQHHSYLVETLLFEISSLQYRLDHGTRDRMHNGILDLHWNEWSKHRDMHGFQIFDKVLANHKEIARYWTDRFLTEQHNAEAILVDDIQSKEKDKNEADKRPKTKETFRKTAYTTTGTGNTVDRLIDQEKVPLNSEHASNQEATLTLEDPWRSSLPHHRRPSIEVTAPEYMTGSAGRQDPRQFPNDPVDKRTRPTVNIPASPASPATSGGQTPISPSELTPIKRQSYERLRSPTSSTQASPSASPYLRQATLHSTYTTSPRESAHELTRKSSKKETTRPRAERAPSSTYDEQLLSPSGVRRPSAKEKLPGSIKLKDPLGRKFKCPLQKCSTWEDMHNLLEAQFYQHEDLLPEVQADEYDLFLADGQRIPIANWADLVCSGLRVTMLLRYGNPAAGFRKKDCLIPFDGEHILAPDMLHYITAQESHNAYRTKLISYKEGENEAIGKDKSNERVERLGRDDAQHGRSRLEDEKKHVSRQQARNPEQDRRHSSAAEAPVLDDVDLLILRLTNIEASELKLLKG